ncbi:MAG TPA: hypothetical protein VFR35_07850 [Actinoplanes sp.]|nr:hypothetical protein [Actinoplanes sp.]
MQSPTSTSSADLVASADSIRQLRAEALFASTLQPSESPSPNEVRVAVATTLRRLGIGGCAGQLAGEYGDHPGTAAVRMTWALAMIRAAYPEPSTMSAPGPRALALAG